jgi:hypothetical protein
MVGAAGAEGEGDGKGWTGYRLFSILSKALDGGKNVRRKPSRSEDSKGLQQCNIAVSLNDAFHECFTVFPFASSTIVSKPTQPMLERLNAHK